jgi:hypothetical protein
MSNANAVSGALRDSLGNQWLLINLLLVLLLHLGEFHKRLISARLAIGVQVGR